MQVPVASLETGLGLAPGLAQRVAAPPARAAPRPVPRKFKGPRYCFNCGQPGHIQRFCRAPYPLPQLQRQPQPAAPAPPAALPANLAELLRGRAIIFNFN